MFSAVLLKDFYKLSHPPQFPANTEYVYSNTTPRSSRISDIDSVVVFGLQYFIKRYLIEEWGKWFNLSETDAIGELTRVTDNSIGKFDVSHYRKLHRLGYLPVRIKALPEGSLCPIGVPFMTIINTNPEFYWVTNMLETLTQCCIWQAITSATIAHKYKAIFTRYAIETGDTSFVPFQGHDFSFRGMSSVETACISGAGHLLSFVGTDTIPAIAFLEEYYGAKLHDELIGCSVPASEHAVMSCGTALVDERETYRRLLQDVYPSGIVSLVSDTYDLWNVLTNVLPSLKDLILSRDGKAVIRPDSGIPEDIICGTGGNRHTPEEKGVVELLWDTFGGTTNTKGYKVLNPKVGVIYGDSITPERAEEICKRLKANGFASTNMVYGIGSYTYQYNTRDTFSIACKATWSQVGGVPYSLFKDPATGSGKKSAKGLLQVVYNGTYILKEDCTKEEEASGCLVPIFEDGQLLREYTLSEIRHTLSEK